MTREGTQATGVRQLVETLSHAQHFSLPNQGTLLDDGLLSLVDRDMHLPFPSVAISYPDIGARTRDTHGGMLVYPKRHLIVATESTFGAVEKTMPGPLPPTLDPAARCITVCGINGMDNGMWMPDPYGFAIACTGGVMARSEPRTSGTGVGDPLGRPTMASGVRYNGASFPSCPGLLAHAATTTPGVLLDAARVDAAVETGIVLGLIEALSCSNVHVATTHPDPKVNAKRLRKGKHPLLATSVLMLDVPTTHHDGAPGTGHHASPRQHLRRGHIRHLTDGRRIWINACVVGAARDGMQAKDYALRVSA
ncbi:MAG TPA: hypothetical protein VF292_03045 [Rhodanobacteraceae bacterium]